MALACALGLIVGMFLVGLFVLPKSAGCSLQSADAHQVFLDNSSAPGSPPDPGSIGAYAAQAVHSNFLADYRLTCDKPGAITTIGFPFFSAFPGTQIIHVVLISDRGQFVFDVSPQQAPLNIAGDL